MSDSIPTYEAVYDEESDNIYSVSLVESPAMESAFITLKKQTESIKLAEVDKKERTLLGIALIPNKPIYRNQDGSEFYITFPKETIQASAHDFLKKGFQLNSKLEHEDEIKGISFVESWIVKDPKNDTANAYSLPKEDIVEGAWVLKMKCDNDEIYNKALSGEIKGFSIDGLFSLKEVKSKNNLSMSKTVADAIKDGFEDFKTFFKEQNKTEVKLGSVKSGDVTIMYDGETLEVGTSVFLENPEDMEQRIALPVGEFPLEDGTILVVTEEGVVAELRTGEAPNEEAPATEEAPAELNDDKQAQEIASAIKSVLIKYKQDADIEAKESNNILLAEIKKLSDQVIELSNEPAGKSIVSTPSQPMTKQGRILQQLRNK